MVLSWSQRRGEVGVQLHVTAGEQLCLLQQEKCLTLGMRCMLKHLLWYAIRLANQMGMGRIIIATDSLNLKHPLSSTAYDQAKLGHLFLDIKYQLIMEFNDFVVEFCPRACNKPADCLAAIGLRESQIDQLLWLSDFPNDVACLVTDELVVS